MSRRQTLWAEGARTVPKILMLGANPLVRDNLLVLLRAMGYHCVVAPRLPEAQVLLEREKPDAAILDPQADSSPGAMVAAFHRRFPDLRDRTIVLTGEETAPDVLKVLDAYSLPRVPLHRLLQHPAEIRTSRSVNHRVLYESEGPRADLSVEPERDSQRVTLVGQVLDTAGPEPQLDSVPVVLHGQTELLGVAKTNEFGEFHFDFDSEPGVTLEIGVKGHHWLLLDVPDTKETRAEIKYESQLPAQPETP